MTSDEHKNIFSYQSDAWNKIVSDSADLLQLAHRKSWNELLELHAKRDQELKDFFAQELAQDLVKTVQADLEKIRQTDQQIVQLVKKNQDELSAEAQQLNQMKKRISDYISAEKSKL